MAQVRRDSWDDFIEEGDKLFEYMLHNFDSMFDNSGTTVKHFNAIPGTYTSIDHTDEIIDAYREDIQKKLIVWIKNELDINELFEKEYWKPFRDESMLSCMYLGYRKLFVYKQYFFQLALEPECMDCGYCDNNEKPYHFELVYYGYKENEDDKFLLPFRYIEVLENNIICKFYWDMK